MSKYRLPDEPEATLREFTRPEKIWNETDLGKWLSRPGLATWVPEWFESLRERFGGMLPDLVHKALGGSGEIPEWMKNGGPEAVWLRRFLSIADSPETWFEQGFLGDDPPWLAKLMRSEEAGVARSFLLNGNISDYAFDPVNGYRHAIRLLADTLKRKKDCVLTYRLSRGLAVRSGDPDIMNRLPKSIAGELEARGYRHDLPLLTEVCRLFDILTRWLTGDGNEEPDSREFERGVAIVFENVHLILPPNAGDIERNYIIDNLLLWSNSPDLFRSSHCLILTAESLEDVSSELLARGGKIEQITIPRPEDARSRLKFILPLLDPRSGMKETRVSGLPAGLSSLEGYSGNYGERVGQLGHDTAGLNLMGIEDLFQEALAEPERRLSRKTVMRMKKERLRQESRGMLELMDPGVTLDDIGGYPSIKARLREVVRALLNSRNPLIRKTIPMGILLLGPPGTGKSFIAEALAGESNINMAKLGNFRGMYVGQSERNLSRIFSLIESLHPVIVFIDEIDQALGKRGKQSGDGGVDSRIFGRFLEFMSDVKHRGNILWIGASNFPEKIDPAMKRAGRFDLVLPVLLPDKDSRRSIIEITLDRELAKTGVERNLTGGDFERLAGRTDGFSGAEIRAIVGEVMRRFAARSIEGPDENIRIDAALFDEVLEIYQPPPAQREDYMRMERRAAEDVSFVDLLPDSYKTERTGK